MRLFRSRLLVLAVLTALWQLGATVAASAVLVGASLQGSTVSVQLRCTCPNTGHAECPMHKDQPASGPRLCSAAADSSVAILATFLMAAPTSSAQLLPAPPSRFERLLTVGPAPAEPLLTGVAPPPRR